MSTLASGLLRSFALCLPLSAAVLSPVQADTAGLPPAASVFLPGEGLKYEAEDNSLEGVRSYQNLRWRGEDFDLGAQSLSLAVQEDGSIKLAAKGMVLRSHVENGPVVSISTLELVLDAGFASSRQPKFCDWVTAASSLRVRDLFVEFPEAAEPFLTKLDLQDVYFERKPPASSCAFRGIAGTGRSEIEMAGGTDILVLESAFQLSLPVLEASAAAGTGTASLRAALTGVEYRGFGEIPAFGFPDTSFALDVSEESLAATLQLLGRSSLWTPTRQPKLDLMQSWNALSDLDGRLLWKAPVVRLYTPGVVPEALIANFSRAGLSTISGAAEFDLRLKDRLVDLKASGGWTGLFDFDASIAAVALPYVREKLEAALSGADLGFHILPDLRIGAAKLTYQDRGFDTASNDILGVPAGRQVEELAGKIRAGADPEGLILHLASVLDGVAMFYRFAAESRPVHVAIGSEEPISIAAFVHMMVTSPQDIVQKLHLSMTRGGTE